MTQNCLNCHQPLEPGAKFCRACGASAQPNFCESCGTSNLPSATFCKACGKGLNTQPFAPQPQQAPRAQQTPRQPAMRGDTKKWLLPGIGGGVIAGVILVVVLFLGGSDSGNKPPEISLAKGVISPSKTQQTSEDLASTIATLNKSQLGVLAQTTGREPVQPKELDKGLQDVAAAAMRTAELANIMSETAVAQATTPEQMNAAAKASQQYDAIAQTAYAQLLEAQNLRLQVAQETASLEQVTQTITNYGAQMWNSGVTISGVQGNPFIPFINGAPGVQVVINLNPPAVQRVNVLLGPNFGGWIAVAPAYQPWPINVTLVPAPYYDPLDNDLLLWMLTYDGQFDPYFAQRYALSRLERYRRGSALDRVGLTGLVGSDWTDVVLTNDRANGRYVNMYGLPDWGTLGMNISLPRGIAVAEAAQLRSGIIPSFAGGYGLAFAPGSTGDLILRGLQLNGADAPLELTSLFMKQAAQGVTVTISRPKVESYKNGVVSVRYDVAWSSTLSGGQSISCDGFSKAGSVMNGSITGVFAEINGGPPGVTITCNTRASDDDSLRQYTASDARFVQVGTKEEIDKANEEKDADRRYWENARKNNLDLMGPIVNPLAAADNALNPTIPKLPPPPPNRKDCFAIAGTPYESDEERAWYFANNCPQVVAGANQPAVQAKPQTSTSNTKPATSGGNSNPVVPAGGSQPNVPANPNVIPAPSGGSLPPVTNLGGVAPIAPIPSSGNTGVIQKPASAGGHAPSGATIPTAGQVHQPPTNIQPLLPKPPVHNAPQTGTTQQQTQPRPPTGNTGTGTSNSGSTTTNSPNSNLNGNRADCIAIAASGPNFIPGGTEAAWFHANCTQKLRDCATLKNTPFQSQTDYERWYYNKNCQSYSAAPTATVVKKQAEPFSFPWPAAHGNVNTPNGKTVEGVTYKWCVTGTLNVIKDGKTVSLKPTDPDARVTVGWNDLKLGPDGCVDYKANGTYLRRNSSLTLAPSPGGFVVNVTVVK